jgi:hypothetical protein
MGADPWSIYLINNLSHISMVEGEVTSRQHGGVHTWDVDAAAVGDGMTRSVVRRSYLRLRARPRPAYVPVATMRNSALARPAGLGPGQRAAQFRPRRGRRRRSFSPSRDGKCAVPVLIHRHETQFQSRRGRWPTCCAVPASPRGRPAAHKV